MDYNYGENKEFGFGHDTPSAGENPETVGTENVFDSADTLQSDADAPSGGSFGGEDHFENEDRVDGEDRFDSAGFKSGEYRYVPPRTAERPTSAGYSYDRRWIDPVIDEADNSPGSFYSPNFRSENTYYERKTEKPQSEETPKKRGGFLKALCLILVCAVFSAAASGFATWKVIERYGVGSNQKKQVVIGSTVAASDSDVPSVSAAVSGNELSGAQIYEELGKKQVVGINTSVTTQNIFGQETSSAVSGTGFIISSDGYILTNYHVIEYSAEYGYELTVMTYDGDEYTAEIVGFESGNDIAVIKIDATNLSPVAFGNSDNIKVGEKVYAIGNPLGELTFTQTQGNVSALDRVIKTDAYTSINMFQIDAAVNNGNSGGPVYNSYGEVIGIVTAKYASSGVEGLGFAIPINDAVTISEQLIENGYVTGKAYLGVNLDDIKAYAIQYYKVPQGAYVYSTVEGACAEKSGIQAGDIITALDGAKVTSVAELKSLLKLHSAGETVTVTVYREGSSVDITVTLDEAPANMSPTVPIEEDLFEDDIYPPR